MTLDAADEAEEPRDTECSRYSQSNQFHSEDWNRNAKNDNRVSKKRRGGTVFDPEIPPEIQERASWSPLRVKTAQLTSSNACETAMGLVIMFNVLVMVIEVNADATCLDDEDSCTVLFCDIANIALLGIYTLDLLMTIFVERWAFHRSRWNQLDAIIVLMGYVEYLLALVLTDAKVLSIVRLLRLARIMRVARLFQPIPELYKLIIGFASTTKAIFWGFLMIMMLLLMWAILTVQVVQSFRDKTDNDDWCSAAFSNVWLTMIFYFQTLVAGDSWGSCAVPYIQTQPALFIVFGGALIMVQLGFTNLILSVIVDAAATTRDADLSALAEERRRQQAEDMRHFYDLLARMDKDQSGSLSFQELMRGYHADVEVQEKLLSLGVDEDDLGELMQRMDTSGVGHVSYAEFCEHMMKAKNSDDRINFLMLKLQVDQVTRMCQNLVDAISDGQTARLKVHCSDSGSANGTKMTPRQSLQPSKLVIAEEKLPASKKDGAMFHTELHHVEERLAALTRAAEAHAAALAKQTFQLASYLKEGGGFKGWCSANDGVNDCVAWEHRPGPESSDRKLLQSACPGLPASPESKAKDSPGNNSSTHGGGDSDVVSESSIKLNEK